MSEQAFKGSCLCGAVSFEITAEVMYFFHCHCSRCRKSTGTGHASNLIVKPSAETWLSGEELIRDFKVPDAERFTNRFCKQCGGRLPRLAPDYSIGVIPAGSLDHDLDLKVQGRIFQDSRVSWSCDDSEMALFETYPQG